VIPWLGPDDPLPEPAQALGEPNGLLAASGDLDCRRVLNAYRKGIFPWYSDGQPVLWWSPDPRMVLYPSELRVTRSLRKRVRNHAYEIRTDTCFEDMMRACAAPRPTQSGTWITDAMIETYTGLHTLGFAHSVETWIAGELAGGLYGVALGRAFFGESMFSRAPDASKIALVHLVRQLHRWQFGIIDCQMSTAHLASLGAREITRADFVRSLDEWVNYPDMCGPWQFDHDLSD